MLSLNGEHAIPHYDFHVQDPAIGDVGIELGDLREAQVYAVRYAGQLLADHPEAALRGQWSLSVTLHGNGTVFEVMLLTMTVPRDALN